MDTESETKPKEFLNDKERVNCSMSKKKVTDDDDIRTVKRVLQLSDSEFEKWLDNVEKAGLKLKAR